MFFHSLYAIVRFYCIIFYVMMAFSSSKPLPFIQKVWDILSTSEHHQLISWTHQGTSFAIKNIETFSKETLPKYFKHSNFSSFVRQLNMYGFHKNKNDLTVHEFSHKMFNMNQPDLLKNIKRKALEESPYDLPVEKSRKASPPTEKKINHLINDDDSVLIDKTQKKAYIPQTNLYPSICTNCNIKQFSVISLAAENEQLQRLIAHQQQQKAAIYNKFSTFLNTFTSTIRPICKTNTQIKNQIISHMTQECEPASYSEYQRLVKLFFNENQNKSATHGKIKLQ